MSRPCPRPGPAAPAAILTHSKGGIGPGAIPGPPLPLKILGGVVAFSIFKPLGVAALAFLLWRSVRGNRGCGFRRVRLRRARRSAAGPGRAAVARRRKHPLSRSAVRRRCRQLDEEAKAFEQFRAQAARVAGQASVRQLYGESPRAQ